MKELLSTEVYCFSYFIAKKECRDLLINALLSLINPTRAEKGCISYELLVDGQNPNLFVMFERFATQQALDEHEQQPYILNFVNNQMYQYCENVSWNVTRKINSF